MAIRLGNVVPRAIALAVVGYCVWPSISELTSQPQPAPAKKVPELAASLFSPTLTPPPARDPFGGTAITAGPTGAKTGLAHGRPAAAASSAAAKAATPPPDPLQGLRLDATCIVGDQRLAVINGKVYAAEERVSAGTSMANSPKIVSVLPYKVVLERDGKTVELTYSNVASRPAKSAAQAGASAATPRAKQLQIASTAEKADDTTAAGGPPSKAKE
jgi:hypothetical protein